MSKSELHVASAGLGVNTVAYLILCTRRGIKFDYIIFSDPGKENPKTYEYIPILNKWLVANGQPEITTVYKKDKNKNKLTLYQDCKNLKSLPPIAYGYKKCSMKFKLTPQEIFLNNQQDAKTVWENGGIVYRYKGYDADEGHRTQNKYDDKKYINVHPLVDADMGRFECVQTIIDEGLPLPPKSSCTFCPSMKPWEIVELYETEPKEFYDAIEMERNAKDNLQTVKGLGRDFSWWDLIVAYKYLKLVKKHKSIGNIPDRIKRLMTKVSRSKPVNYESLASLRTSAKDNVCDLFSQNIDMPCECMN